ncbi:MAG: type II TA system antitoxin MqsA family protein [Candidatus Latescibacterota bacterium]
MNDICPQCEEIRDIKTINSEVEIDIRGEKIKVNTKYYQCSVCGEEFEDLNGDSDSLNSAYREYRRRHGMLQPEEIRELRKRYGLTQRELSTLLGWGGATLSRYETGALQDEAHDKLLQFIKNPQNLLTLVEQKPEAITESTRKRIEDEVRGLKLGTPPLITVFEERFGSYEPGILSGYLRLDLSKLMQAILFFCREGIVKTKLNKLLFYADFKHFRETTVSITGARYVRMPYGPVPDNYELLYAMLVEERKDILVREIVYGDDCVGEEYLAVRNADLAVFSQSELMVLKATKKHFRNFSAKKTSDFSHQEKGYIDTPPQKLISYEFAKYLRF